MALLDETKEILADLIGFPTVSSDSNLELITYAAERLTAAGATISIQRDEAGHKANLLATIGPEIDGGIVLSGHTDVVPADGEWTSDPFEMREAGGLLYGRGACDMKGFVAAALAMAPIYARGDLKRPIHFAFTYDEETGCLGGRQLVEELKRMQMKPSTAIIGEPTGMGIIEGHKGCFEYTTEFTGLEGHGSQPDLGVNAVEYAVRYIARLMELGEAMKPRAPKGSRFDPPWTTVQVGRIEGGTARNVIAGRCAVEWEMRPVRTEDADDIKSQLHAYCRHDLLPAMRAVSPEADIVTHTIGEVAGLEPVSDNEARTIVTELTGSNEAGVVAFGTEAGLFQEIGMSAVICGPGSIEQAHKPDEYVSVTQLQHCLDMLTGLNGRLRA
ncbi:MAG: acetylornithine deacetylase [Nitratireductor sp.]|nr:acetylornithine deacetylase [Nitratireductor sp.]